MFVLSQTCPDVCMYKRICLRLLHSKSFTLPVGDNTNRGGTLKNLRSFCLPMFVLSQTCLDACASKRICLQLLHPKRFTMPVGDNTIGVRKIKKGVILRLSKYVGKGLLRHAFTFCIGANALAYAPRAPFEYLRVTPNIRYWR